MTIKTVSKSITRHELQQLAQETYKEMVKAVVDIHKRVLAVGGELHADAETVLLDDVSRQEDLWGVNFYPAKPELERIQYTSLINLTLMSISGLSRRREIARLREAVGGCLIRSSVYGVTLTDLERYFFPFIAAS